jgi:hypothetical protein
MVAATAEAQTPKIGGRLRRSPMGHLQDNDEGDFEDRGFETLYIQSQNSRTEAVRYQYNS